METLSCKCILEYKSYRINDEPEDKGGPFTFIVGEIYSYVIIEDNYWGNCYVVTDGVTGFSIGFDDKKFDLSFEKII
jgi:hypothetical protein